MRFEINEILWGRKSKIYGNLISINTSTDMNLKYIYDIIFYNTIDSKVEHITIDDLSIIKIIE